MIEVRKSLKNRLDFVVKSESGRTLLRSIEFQNQGEIEQTMKQLTSSAKHQNRIERKTNFDGKFLFDLKNGENKIIGSSRLYSSEAGMENGIKNLMRCFTTL